MAMTTAERLKAKKQEVVVRAAARQNTYRWTLPSTEVRILPSWRPETHVDPTFFHDFGLSWIKDQDGTVLAVVADRKITYGEDDVVRNTISGAIGKQRTDAQRKHFKEMLASPRVICNGLVLNDPNVDPTEPQILEFSEGQWSGPVTDLIVAAEAEGDDIISLDKGFNLTVGKTGKGFDTRYSFVLARRASAVDVKVLAKLHDIDAFIEAKFADGDKAVNAIKSLLGDGPVALIERSTDLIEDRRSTVDTDVTDADYSEAPDANVENVAISDEQLDELFA